MTPRETLEKYGLKTDVKSIRERIIHNDYSCISEIEQEQRSADILLLCEMAEECEEIKKRAEKKRKDAGTKESPTVMLLLGYEQIIELIDFIIKGEGK